MVQVIKTFHGGHGRLSLGRVLSGTLKDGAVLQAPRGDTRVGGILALCGDKQVKKSEARAGDTVALARLDNVQTGDRLSSDKALAARAAPALELRRSIASPSRPATARMKSRSPPPSPS